MATHNLTIPLDAALDRQRYSLTNANRLAVLSTDGPFAVHLTIDGDPISMLARGDKLEVCPALREVFITVDAADVVADGEAVLLVSGGEVNATLNGSS